MRVLTDTFLAAQLLDAREPYLYLRFTSAGGGTTYDYPVTNDGTSRTLQVEHEEWAYSENAYILLNNSDRTVPDLRGYWIEIGYGDYGSIGAEYALTPRMWVIDQRMTSAPGVLSMLLKLKGMWYDLETFEVITKGTAPYFKGVYNMDTTIYNICAALMTSAGHTLNALATNDGILNTFMPYLEINNNADHENTTAVVYRIVNLTAEYLRPLPSKQWEFIYPQEADAVNETYYTVSTTGYIPCYSYTNADKELIPNHILTYCNKASGENETWAGLITGEASDATSIARYKDKTEHRRLETVTLQADATNLTAAMLIHVRAESNSAYLEIGHDARVQLYDKVSMIDLRET